LFFELLSSPVDNPIGIALISPVKECILCGSTLHLRRDRPSAITIHDDKVGTISGIHFYKNCKSQSCGCTQFYGYYTEKGSIQVFFNANWKSMPYFVSAHKTVLLIALMRRFEA